MDSQLLGFYDIIHIHISNILSLEHAGGADRIQTSQNIRLFFIFWSCSRTSALPPLVLSYQNFLCGYFALDVNSFHEFAYNYPSFKPQSTIIKLHYLTLIYLNSIIAFNTFFHLIFLMANICKEFIITHSHKPIFEEYFPYQ